MGYPYFRDNATSDRDGERNNGEESAIEFQAGSKRRRHHPGRSLGKSHVGARSDLAVRQRARRTRTAEIY
jgi:hypothetical protein